MEMQSDRMLNRFAFVTHSQKKLVCFFVVFFGLVGAFQAYLFLSSKDQFLSELSGALFFSFAIACAIGGLSPWPGLRFIGWVAIALIVAIVCSGPHRLLLGTGERHGWAWLMFPRLFIWGLATAGTGTLLGYFLRRFLTPK